MGRLHVLLPFCFRGAAETTLDADHGRIGGHDVDGQVPVKSTRDDGGGAGQEQKGRVRCERHTQQRVSGWWTVDDGEPRFLKTNAVRSLRSR